MDPEPTYPPAFPGVGGYLVVDIPSLFPSFSFSLSASLSLLISAFSSLLLSSFLLLCLSPPAPRIGTRKGTGHALGKSTLPPERFLSPFCAGELSARFPKMFSFVRAVLKPSLRYRPLTSSLASLLLF